MNLSATQHQPSLQAPKLWERGLWLVVVYSFFFGCYGAANRSIPVASGTDLTLAFDRATPFIPEFVYPFWLAYVVIPAPALLFKTRAELIQAASAFVWLILLSCAIFVFFPVTVPRPTTLPDTLAGSLVSQIYQADQPVCGFPSLHVSATLLAARIGWRAHRGVGAFLAFFWLLTSAATLLVKQHVLLDVLGGIAIALFADTSLHYVWSRIHRPQRPVSAPVSPSTSQKDGGP